MALAVSAASLLRVRRRMRACQWQDRPTNDGPGSTVSLFPAASGGRRVVCGSASGLLPSARTRHADAPLSAFGVLMCGSGWMARADHCACGVHALPCAERADAAAPRVDLPGCKRGDRWTQRWSCAPLLPVPSARRSALGSLRRENDSLDRFLIRLSIARRSSMWVLRRVERPIRLPRNLRAKARRPAPSGP